MTRCRTYICNPLLPSREIHLIAGGSGAGKSTFACQIALDLINGGEFFGLPVATPQAVAYIAFDRSEDGMRDTFIRTIGSDTIPFPFYSVTTSKEFAKPEFQTAPGAIARVHDLHPELDILFLDAIGMAFTGDSASLSEVSKFIRAMVRELHSRPRPLAVFALHHMGKVKKGNEYAAPRSRIHGSVAWAATSETVILIEPEKEEDAANPHRIITLCPRNAPERVFTYTFDEDGRLVQAASLKPGKTKFECLLDWIQTLDDATDIPGAKIEAEATRLEISRPSHYRYIADLCEQKVLIKVRRGVYQRQGVSLKSIR